MGSINNSVCRCALVTSKVPGEQDEGPAVDSGDHGGVLSHANQC